MRWRSVFLLFLLISSCADLEKDDFLGRIEKIDGELVSMQEKLSANRVDSPEEKTAQCKQLISEVKQLEPDTISLNLAEKIDRFMRYNEILPVTLEMEQHLHKDLDQMRKDLAKLRKDIENGDGKRHKYESYVQQEEAKLSVISERFERCSVLQEELKAHLEKALNEVETALHEPISVIEVQ